MGGTGASMPQRLGLPRADLGSGRVIDPAGRVGLAAQIPARQSDGAGPNGCKAECSARLIHIEQDDRLAWSGNSETALPIRGHERVCCTDRAVGVRGWLA